MILFVRHMFTKSKLIWLGLVFLSIGAVLTVTIFGYFFYNQYPDSPVDTTSMSDFELAEYYFNHGGEGEYDLAKARKHYGLVIINADEGGIDASEVHQSWYQLGRIDFLEGKFDAAIYKFNRLLDLYGEVIPNVHYMLGLTYGYKARKNDSDEDWQAGADAFSTFIDFAPESPWPRVDLAWIYFSQGKYEEMKPVLEKGLEYRPDNPWLLNMYGLALLNTDNKEEAGNYFAKAKESASLLTEEDWGQSYPGNNPEIWGEGLAEFRSIIEHNLELSKN